MVHRSWRRRWSRLMLGRTRPWCRSLMRLGTLFGPVEFAMTAPAVAAVAERVSAVLPGAAVKVGWRRPGTITERC
jgi:hypothetical protein